MPAQRSGDHKEAFEHTVEHLLTDHQVAEITGMSLAWVRRRRLRKLGPPFKKLGGCIRYDPAELRAWLSALPGGGEPGQGTNHE